MSRSEAHDAAVGEVHRLRADRALFMDERGLILRAAWHLEHGLVNLSLWEKGNGESTRCVGTFRLSVADAGRLAQFLVAGLTDAALEAFAPGAAAVDEPA